MWTSLLMSFLVDFLCYTSKESIIFQWNMKKKSEKSSINEGLLIFAFVNTIIGFIYIEIIFVYLNKMKIVYFLFASVLLFINCRDECEGKASKKSECTDYKLVDNEKDEDWKNNKRFVVLVMGAQKRNTTPKWPEMKSVWN